MRRMRARHGWVLGALFVATSACKGSDAPAAVDDAGAGDSAVSNDATLDGGGDGGDGAPVASTPVVAKPASTKVEVQRLMFASGEMQISGEPFAEHFMGRNLDGYDRTQLPTDQYSPSAKGGDEIVDLVGFSTAVESYEYSKFHVNMVSVQNHAGPSLAWGPIVNKGASTATDEPTVRQRLVDREGALLRAVGADVAGFAVVPPPTTNPYNLLGFSGLHPIAAPYRSFDAAFVPDQLVGSCTFTGGYAVFSKAERIPDYECGYHSLEIPRAQMETVLSPGALGMLTWKQALWGIDFCGRVHDAGGNFVSKVDPADEPNVGKSGNTVVGKDDTGAATEKGTYLASLAIEGTWGLNYVEEMDNGAQWLLSGLATRDGSKLAGFATIKDALAYDYGSPPVWWPTAVTVTEGAPKEWPGPATMKIAPGDAKSHAEDLAAVLLGHALFFGMTDARNAAIGGRIGLRLTFDGDPFPADDGTPNGEATAHDRALAVLRVGFVDLDRLHTLAGTGVIADVVDPAATPLAAEPKVTTTSLAHVTIALRQTLLALNAAITQYGGADPNPKLDDQGILNSIPIHPPGGDVGFSTRVRTVLVAQATFVRDVLTRDDGSVAVGATFDPAGKPTVDPAPATLEAQTAAIRALLEGFLATGDTTFVDRARACYKKLEGAFYVADARFWRGVAGGPDTVSMTPERFAFLQSAIREVHKIANVPGDPTLAKATLEDRIARANKLFLNGWDDANGDRKVQKSTECLAGRLQLGEQALTGEYGKNAAGDLVGDRDDDCVLNISWSKQASLLSSQVDYSVKR